MHRRSDEKRPRVLSGASVGALAGGCDLRHGLRACRGLVRSRGAALLVLPFGLLGGLLIADRRRLRRRRRSRMRTGWARCADAIDDTYLETVARRMKNSPASLPGWMRMTPCWSRPINRSPTAARAVLSRPRLACHPPRGSAVRSVAGAFRAASEAGGRPRPGGGPVDCRTRLQTALAGPGPRGQGDPRMSGLAGDLHG